MKCFHKLEPRTCTIEELRASLNLHPPSAEVIPVVAGDGSIGFAITDEGNEVSEALIKQIQGK